LHPKATHAQLSYVNVNITHYKKYSQPPFLTHQCLNYLNVEFWSFTLNHLKNTSYNWSQMKKNRVILISYRPRLVMWCFVVKRQFLIILISACCELRTAKISHKYQKRVGGNLHYLKIVTNKKRAWYLYHNVCTYADVRGFTRFSQEEKEDN